MQFLSVNYSNLHMKRLVCYLQTLEKHCQHIMFDITDAIFLFYPKNEKVKNTPRDRCIVNDKRYPERMIVYSNVKDRKLVFHKLPVNEERQRKQRKGRFSVSCFTVCCFTFSVNCFTESSKKF